MEFFTIAIFLLFCFPLFSSFLNGVDIALSLRSKVNPLIDRAKLVLLFFYISTGAVWFLIILFQFDWKIYPYLSSLYFSFGLLWIVVFYHYLFCMTSADKDERMGYGHYALPLLFCMVLMVYPFFRPLNIHFEPVSEQIVIVPIHSGSYVWVYTLAVFRRLFMVGYGVMCYSRLKRFAGETDKGDRRTRWLWGIFAIYCVITLVTILRLFHYPVAWPVILLTATTAVSLVVLQTVTCFYMLRGNFRLATANTTGENPAQKRSYTTFQKSRYKSYNNKKKRVGITIDRSGFENYFRLKKPYLDPDLKIGDLTEPFQACTSVLSAYINKTYGMSFSWYVNGWRLKEMERLMKLKSNNGKDAKDLALKAGFGSYRSYMRAKAYFNNQNTSPCDL